MERIDFANGFYAYYSPETSILRLYTPDDMCISALPYSGKSAKEVSEGMMYGYFSGFRDCKRRLKRGLCSLIDRTGVVDVQK